MSFDRNGQYCPHSIIDVDETSGETWCTECGDVLEDEDEPLQDL